MSQHNNTTTGLQVVAGLGVSGISAARYLIDHGYDVAVTDNNAAPPLAHQLPQTITERRFGGLDTQLLSRAARIIISPGISLETPAIARAIESGIAVVSDIQLFALANTAPIIAITGSNAKTTVTTLVGQMARDAGINVGVGGNIGVPALELLGDPDMALVVLELSSFQLETITDLGAQVATVLNMSPDHLDRHGDMLGYHQAKHRIFQGARSVVVNRDDPKTQPLMHHGVPVIGVGIDAPSGNDFGLITSDDGKIYIARGNERLICADDMKIKGRHNLINAQAALALGTLAGLPLDSMIDSLRRFCGLDHRAQFVASIDGVDYFNDSKGTNIGATMAAIEGLGAVYAPKDGKLLLILGGQGKGQAFGVLTALINRYVSQLIFIGEDAARIEADIIAANLSSAIGRHQCQTLEGALDQAQQLCQSSLSQVAAVVLSPACASFDQYSGFASRGDHFRQLVAQMGDDAGV